MPNLIMSWSKCTIEIGKTGDADAMALSLTSIGTIADRSTSLESADGDVLEMKASGGVTVAKEQSEGEISLKTRIIEPDFAFLATLIDANHDDVEDKLTVKSQIVNDPYSVKLTPKNTGGTGLEIRKASVTYKDGYSEEEGQYADVTFTVLACADGELYTKFKKA